MASTTAYADFYPILETWPEYQRRRALPPLMSKEGDDLHRTIAWAINDAPLNIWNLDRLDGYRRFLHETAIFTPDWLAPFEQRLLHPHRPADPAAILNALGKPILILHGEQDMSFPVDVAQRLHASVPSSQLVIIPDCGHQAPFEKPDEWAAAVGNFLL